MGGHQRVMAVVGAGVIGMSWARLARRHGWRVGITDTRVDLDAIVAEAFGEGDPYVFSSCNAADVLKDADLVQENGPECLRVKQELFSLFLDAAPADAVLATSSSSIGANAITAGVDDGERIIVGHPSNPPELIPLVEVVPGMLTGESTVHAAVSLYEELGRSPIVIRKEIPGLIVNRLRAALTREAQYLVEQGVVGVADLDTALQNSLGLEWAAAGLFESNAWSGGKGVRDSYGSVVKAVGTTEFGAPSSDPESVDRLASEIEAAYGVDQENHQERLGRRDRRTLAILDALYTVNTLDRLYDLEINNP